MHFSGGINRPPYETADGYLQTTEGCTHNSCAFCNMYQDVPFRIAVPLGSGGISAGSEA